LGLRERRIREKENRRHAILNAARRLFFERGFRPVTVDSIAKKAELSKGAIYLHFDSKEEIYAQILLLDIEQFHANTAKVVQQGGSASEMLLKLSDTYVDFFLNDKELFRILMTFMVRLDRMNLSDEVGEHLIRTTNKSIAVIEEILQHGVSSGEYPPDLNIRNTRNAIWGLFNGIISLYFFAGKEARREERIRSTVRTSLEILIKGLKSSG